MHEPATDDAPDQARGRAVTATAIQLAGAWLLLLALGYGAGRLVVDTNPGIDPFLTVGLRGSGGGNVPGVMRFITDLGGAAVLDVVFVLAFAGLALLRRWRDAVFLVLASPGIVLLVQILKQTVHRPRPSGPHLAEASGFSWPSGHASSSMALYGGLVLIGLPLIGRFRQANQLRTVVIWAAVALIAAIGVSRVYLGVHYPTDVLASWTLVAIWLTILEVQVGHSWPRHAASSLGIRQPFAPRSSPG